MTSALERRYRRLLGWYPRSWRAVHGEAFVGTLLDVADGEDRTHPTHQEQWAIAGHGIEARLDRIVLPEVRNAASTAALAMGAGLGLAEFVFTSWSPWIHSNPAPGLMVQIGPFRDTGFVYAALWGVALSAALAGRWAVGRATLLILVLLATVSPYFLASPSGVWSVDRATLFLLSTCAVVAALGRPHRSHHTAAAAVGWALLGALSYVSTSDLSEWLSSRSIWNGNLYAWYATGVLELAAIGLALARYWRAAFTIVLSLAPYVGALSFNRLRGYVGDSGSVTFLAVPLLVGLLLLFLHSSGRLELPPAPSRRTFP